MAEAATRLRFDAWPVALVLAVVVLLPFGRGAEAPVTLGALAGIVLLARRRIDWACGANRLVLALFACYWIPALVSAAGAVDPGKTWSTVATTLRFLPFALFSAWALQDARRWPALVAAVAAVVALWLLDAWVQMATGWSLGGPAEKERLSGIFGAGNLKLGPALSVLSPFVLLAARSRFGRRGLVLAFVAMAPVILLAGSRAAWLSYALVCALLAWRETRSHRQFFVVLAAVALAVAALATVALRDSARFDARVQRSLLALSGTEAGIDAASAGRLTI
uniref:polymerase n=1 Tax=Dokdonella sp. TaxID=2291710 RepID=UPI002611F725